MAGACGGCRSFFRRGHVPRHLWLILEVTISTQLRLLSRAYSPPSSMRRTMLNRVAGAAIASACYAMASPTAAFAQAGGSELVVRIDRLENQIRQLTGQLEQLQYRNQQLE